MKQKTNRKISWTVIRYIRCSLLGHLLPGKGTIRAGEEVLATSQWCKGNMPGQGTIRADQNF